MIWKSIILRLWVAQTELSLTWVELCAAARETLDETQVSLQSFCVYSAAAVPPSITSVPMLHHSTHTERRGEEVKTMLSALAAHRGEQHADFFCVCFFLAGFTDYWPRSYGNLAGNLALCALINLADSYHTDQHFYFNESPIPGLHFLFSSLLFWKKKIMN